MHLKVTTRIRGRPGMDIRYRSAYVYKLEQHLLYIYQKEVPMKRAYVSDSTICQVHIHCIY